MKCATNSSRVVLRPTGAYRDLAFVINVNGFGLPIGGPDGRSACVPAPQAPRIAAVSRRLRRRRGALPGLARNLRDAAQDFSCTGIKTDPPYERFEAT